MLHGAPFKTIFPLIFKKYVAKLVVLELLAVALVVAQGLGHRVAAEFFEGTASYGESDHGFGSDSGSGDHADIRAFIRGFDGLARGKIHRLQWTSQRRNWFEVAADADFFAVRNAAFDASSVVVRAGECGESAGGGVADFVVHLRAGDEGGRYSRSDLYRFDGLQRHHRSGKLRVEALVPLRVGAEAWRDIVSDDFEDPAERISCFEDFVDFFFHLLFDSGVGAV